MNLIIKAKEYARNAHKGQKRKYNGEDYIVHPFRVASHILSLPDATEEMVCAGFLHDVWEDCGVTKGQLVEEFHQDIADMVIDLSSYSKQVNCTENRNIRKRMDHGYLAQQSAEVKTIKMIDRFDNLNDMPLNEPFLQKYLAESLELWEVIKDGHEEWSVKLRKCIDDLSYNSRSF